MMHCSSDRAGCTARCFRIAVLVVVGIAALGGVIMLLWNWLMPALFAGARPVGYFQALGILLLSRILFGAFRGGCPGRWREHRQRWESLSPEERANLKARFKGRWGACAGAPEEGGDASEDAPERPA